MLLGAESVFVGSGIFKSADEFNIGALIAPRALMVAAGTEAIATAADGLSLVDRYSWLAPSLEIIRPLQKEGAKIRAYDPKAMDKAIRMPPEATKGMA